MKLNALKKLVLALFAGLMVLASTSSLASSSEMNPSEIFKPCCTLACGGCPK